MKTEISWSDRNWHTVFGCSKVSRACEGCYAIPLNHRIASNAHNSRPGSIPVLSAGTTHKTDDGLDWTGLVRTTDEPRHMDAPKSWRDPAMVFVNSRSDTFHDDVPWEHIEQMWDVMAACPRHAFQILTKRPKRAADLLLAEVDRWREWAHNRADVHEEIDGPLDRLVGLPNVWLGTSIGENKYCFYADHIRRAPAAIRWISAEPLIEPLPDLDLTDIDWVVVGGESGRGDGVARMDLDWARDIRDMCREERRDRAIRAVDHDRGYTAEFAPGYDGGPDEAYDAEEERQGPFFYFKQTGSVLAKELGLKEWKGEDHTEDKFPDDLRIQEFPAGWGR